jgi:hypothetical protein
MWAVTVVRWGRGDTKQTKSPASNAMGCRTSGEKGRELCPWDPGLENWVGMLSSLVFRMLSAISHRNPIMT